MPSHGTKRPFALTALAALVLLASLASSASADFCTDQRARCLKRCGGKEADMDFDCRDRPNARSVSCSCANGMTGFSGGDSGGGGASFAGGGTGASFAGTGLGGGSFGGLSPDQVARDGFSNVARVARGESPLFFGGDNEGGAGEGSGGSGTKQQPRSFEPSPPVRGSTAQSATPAWAIALAVVASLVAATCAGALGFVAMRRHERKAAALAETPSLPMFDSAKPSAFAPSSPAKTGHASL